MFMIAKKVLLLLFVILAGSCSEYQAALKSEDIAVKFAESEKQYAAGKYSKAIILFEQMATEYRGKPQAEKMFYMYSQSLFKTKQYYTAAYQFESFASSYPKSEKIEEAKYLGALCFSKLSPVYTLDQMDTNKAIEFKLHFRSKYSCKSIKR
jgi:outer membrane protein assembly factor BamD